MKSSHPWIPWIPWPHIAGEAAALVVLQSGLVLLVGNQPMAGLATAAAPAYILGVRWADPKQLVASDVAIWAVLLGVFSLPVAAFAGVEWWGLNLVLSLLGAGLARIPVLPAQVEDTGLEAHLERVRRGEAPKRRIRPGNQTDRPNAERPNLAAGLDPLSSVLGGTHGGAGSAASDPYENTRTMHIDPERDL